MRAAIYARVSRADQSSEMQADEAIEFVSRRGWKQTRVYSDDGVSGATGDRAAYRELLDDARRRRFDVLVVWRSDRLFRSLREFVLVLDELRALGIAFASVTEPMDTTTPSGTLLLHIVGAFAEFERETIRERTRAGLARARRAGKRLGRPRVPLDLERVRVLRSEGKTLDAIAAELGVTRDAVFRALHADTPTRSI